jgi:poly-gamma-glutamate synthesis protein (capsule biosynthesis protein)
MSNSYVEIIAVGDVMLGDGPLSVGKGVSSTIKRIGSEVIFEHIKPILKNGDVVFANLEAVLADVEKAYAKDKHFTLLGAPSSIEGLKYAGFNVLSIANNHALEYGSLPLLETIELLENSGVMCIGLTNSNLKYNQPRFRDCNNTRLAFLAYCLVNDPTAYTTTDDADEIYTEIKNAKTQADAVIVSMHWGDEYIQRPSVSQIEMAHKMVDSGASLILGHHPHVVQGVEKYKNALIAYSLGNFVFDMDYIPKTRNSFILECSLSKNGGVQEYKIHPVYINDNFQPVPLQNSDKEKALENMDYLSSLIRNRDDAYAQSYNEELLSQNNLAKRQMKLHFLRNKFRYPPGFTVNVIRDYVRKLLN